MSETITSTGEIGSTLPVETAPGPDVQTASGEATPQPAATDASEADSSTADDVPTDAEDAGADPDEPKKPKGVQKRIDELTEARRRAEREADHWREMAQRHQPQRQDQQPTPQGPAALHPDLAAAIGQPPKPDDFPAGEFDPGYIEARIEHKLRSQQAQQVMRQRQQAAQYAEQQTAQAFAAKVDEARTKYADFDAVVNNPSLPINQMMAQTIAESDHAADIAYHLGKNPAEAARIAALSPVKAAREIGRIEARLEARPAPSAAPAPPSSTLRGNGASASRDPNKMPYAEYKAWRMSGGK